MLTEENITMTILDDLEKKKWRILCFDYPQSGTGIYFKSANLPGEKNRESINPDIIATKDNVSLYFENKSYYYQPDIDLIKSLKVENPYRLSIDIKLRETKNTDFYYGVGLPFTLEIKTKVKKMIKNNEIDFAILVNDDKKLFWYK